MEIQLLSQADGPYVELNIGGDERAFQRGHADSYYLDSYLFALFAASFGVANSAFDRHGNTPYVPAVLPRLHQALAEQKARLADINGPDRFLETIESLSGHRFLQMLEQEGRDYRFEWPALWVKLLSVNVGLLALVDKCATENRVLWVLGF